MFRLAQPSSWAELVFHVLAHVSKTAHLPASICDDVYTAFVASHAGPVSVRALDEDAAVLGHVFENHVALSRAQLVTRLFDSTATALARATTDLDDLTAPASLRLALRPIATGVELLRCAALLEAPVVDALPSITLDETQLRTALASVLASSPTLHHFTIVPIVALRLRGRLMGQEIWTGLPCNELALSPTHVAWQAAHEATVAEVSAASRGAEASLEERGIEHIALVLMTERAAESKASGPHGTWQAHFAHIPEPHRNALPASSRALLERLRKSDADA